MTTRINARLDAALARKVEALRKRTGQSTTEIVKASLETYCVAMAEVRRPSVLLADLVGCARGPADLSRTYKQRLTRSLMGKNRR
jgi:hypothetical protein